MSESIGTRLRQAREKRQLGLEQVSETTRIRIHYLRALEDDDLSAIPSAAQARGFLRLYADFLGLQASDLVPPQPVAPPPAPAATAEPATQPKPGASTQPAARVADGARPGLLHNLRGFFRRRGAAVPKAADVPAPSAAAPGPTEHTPGPESPPKKKLKI